MHGAGCKGGNKIYGGAGRCHSHTAHPHRNKVWGGAEKTPHSGHSSPCRSQEGKFLLVCPAQQPVHSWSDRLPLQIRDCMLMMMMVRWSHKGVVLLLLLKGAQTKKCLCWDPSRGCRVMGSHLLAESRALLLVCWQFALQLKHHVWAGRLEHPVYIRAGETVLCG